jgi:hypothetical protein
MSPHFEVIMRIVVLTLALLAAVPAVSGCSSTGNSAAAINAMNNPPNSCGPGGKADVVDCPDGA